MIDEIPISPSTTSSTSSSVPIVRHRNGTSIEVMDDVVVEEPLEIRVRGRAISVTMRTPGQDEELAAGFLLTEGLIRSRADVLQIVPCGRNEFGNVIDVQLAPLVPVDFEKLTRHVFASSSCGLCGKATIDSIRTRFAPIESVNNVVSIKTISQLPHAMRAAQPTFDRTGGLHAAALFDRNGRLIVLREDVGRHNAVDKVIGHMFLNGGAIEPDDILLVSGRTSFEILQKALAGRIAIVVAVSAPSSLAVEFARENKQTLIGFLRDDRMNIYTGAGRLAINCSGRSFASDLERG